MTKLNSVSSVSHDSSEIWVIHSCLFFVCLVIVVHESLVCPEQFNCQQINRLLFLQKNPSGPTNSYLSSIFVYLNLPFQQWTVWFWDPSFHTEDNWGIHVQTITEGSNHALRARGLKTFEQNGDVYIFLFCLNVIFCHLVLTFRGYRR